MITIENLRMPLDRQAATTLLGREPVELRLAEGGDLYKAPNTLPKDLLTPEIGKIDYTPHVVNSAKEEDQLVLALPEKPGHVKFKE